MPIPGGSAFPSVVKFATNVCWLTLWMVDTDLNFYGNLTFRNCSQVHLREFSEPIARVPDTECLRIQLDPEADVDCRLHTGGQD
jgi:hypothetical protein